MTDLYINDAPTNPVKINVDYLGHAWVVDIFGNIHRYTGQEWLLQDGYAKFANAVDVRRGKDEKIWIMSAYGTVEQLTDNLEQVYLNTATQSAEPSDIDSNALNPIKRAGFFTSDKT
jgi:hypothetical protein